MSDDVEETWDDGHLTQDDVIESADHTGYTSPSGYYVGENGYEPDSGSEYEDHSDDHADDHDDDHHG